jgi:aryl-alcohol dehydrogenase-like predicted oxidoreductase
MDDLDHAPADLHFLDHVHTSSLARVRYRRLGSSDLHVSEISLGSWLTFSGGVERERAVACVERAFEVGINFIDTANVYGRGASESFLGDVLSSRPRDSYVLATKVYHPMSADDHGLSRARSRPRSTCPESRSSSRASPSTRCSRAGRRTA